MSKRDEQAEIERAERALRTLGDTLRRAAKNADALDLKPEVKAWLLDQFGQSRPKSNQPVTDKTLEYTRDIIRQLSELEQQAIRPVSDKTLESVLDVIRQKWEQEHQAKPTSGKNRHTEKEQGRRKSKQDGEGLPPH